MDSLDGRRLIGLKEWIWGSRDEIAVWAAAADALTRVPDPCYGSVTASAHLPTAQRLGYVPRSFLELHQLLVPGKLQTSMSALQLHHCNLNRFLHIYRLTTPRQFPCHFAIFRERRIF